MRRRDLIGLALFALARHKLRAALATLGVLFGTMVLVVSLSVRKGVNDTIVRQVSKYAELRRIELHPGAGRPAAKEPPLEGEMSDARRERLLRERRRRFGGGEVTPPEHRLTRQRLREVAALPHVRRVEPVIRYYGQARLGDEAGERTRLLAIPADLRDNLNGRLVAGELPGDEDGGAAVSEMLLYQLGARDEAAQARLLGRPITFEVPLRGGQGPAALVTLLTGRPAEKVRPRDEELLGKLLGRLRPSLGRLGLSAEEQSDLNRLLGPDKARQAPRGPDAVRASYPIRGVVRAGAGEEALRRGAWAFTEVDLFIGRAAAERLADRVPGSAEHGHGEAIVEVDDPENVKAVQESLRAAGLRAESAVEYIDREQFTYLVVFTGMSVVALIALVVAGIGITNTMLMSVLERVREIGVMKAVGAREGHVQALFLMEGALLGAAGGLLGLLAARGLAYPADAWLRRLVAERLKVQLDGSLFAFPWWLTAGAPLFAVLLTTLSAWWPARRAVRVDPVQALRHE